MAVAEGGGELAKQLVGRTYDMAYPGVVAVYLTGKPNPGVGPQDVALALVGATYANGYVKNKVMEFVGPRRGGSVRRFPQWHRRHDHRDHMLVQHLADRRGHQGILWTFMARPRGLQASGPRRMWPTMTAAIELDLSTVECMIALPMHPSYAYPIRELKSQTPRRSSTRSRPVPTSS